MRYAMISESNITGGVAVERFEADNIEDAWQKADDMATKNKEVMVFPLSEGSAKTVRPSLFFDQRKFLKIPLPKIFRLFSTAQFPLILLAFPSPTPQLID